MTAGESLPATAGSRGSPGPSRELRKSLRTPRDTPHPAVRKLPEGALDSCVLLISTFCLSTFFFSFVFMKTLTTY